MNSKKIIIFIIVLLLIIAIVLVILLNILRKNEINTINELNSEEEYGDMLVDSYADLQNGGIGREVYFEIQRCVKKYLDTANIKNTIYFDINENEEFVQIVNDDFIKNSIYNLLSEEYIEKNDITVENIYRKVKIFEQPVSFLPLEISVVKDGYISKFLLYGLIVDEYNYSLVDDAYMYISIDVDNSIFSIEPIYGNYENISEIKNTDSIKEIKANKDNVYGRYAINYSNDANNYINLYKGLSIAKPEIMYNLLDKEYREKRFGSLENFEKYINNNKEDIMKIRAESYLVNNHEGYTEYVIKDQYGNYYIFDEKAVLNYTLKLDTYTTDQEKFEQTYKTATNKDKVLMNLDKFFQMLNANDYKTAYSLLDDNYKATYFQTEESFENFVKQYMYPHANTKYMNFSDEISGVFTYYVELTNKANASDKMIGMNVVMQLRENTDFKLSFTIVN